MMTEPDVYKRLTFVIAPETLRCLRLYALSQDMSLSAVLRSISKNWLKDNCLTEEVLKDQISNQLTEEWTKRRFIDPEVSIDEFIGDMKKGMGDRLGLTTTLEMMEEWKSKLKQ